jgi:hypothetical protein
MWRHVYPGCCTVSNLDVVAYGIWMWRRVVACWLGCGGESHKASVKMWTHVETGLARCRRLEIPPCEQAGSGVGE